MQIMVFDLFFILGMSIWNPLPDNIWVTENCEKASCSLWKTKFPVEAGFPTEIILSCYVLNTYTVVDQGEATY